MSYPCGNCGKNCCRGCIACENCKTWFHYKCEKLTIKQFEYLSKSSFDYICLKCTGGADGKFDYDKSIKRLEHSSNNGTLKGGVEVELIFLRGDSVKPLSARLDFFISTSSLLPDDPISKKILEQSNVNLLCKRPVNFSGHGDCLFNALSMCFVGSEDLSSEIKVKTCIDIVKTRNCTYQIYNTT